MISATPRALDPARGGPGAAAGPRPDLVTRLRAVEICDIDGADVEEDAVFLLFDGNECSFSRFNCCEPESQPATGGDRIVMVDADVCTEGSFDPGWDATNDGEVPVGDDNWDVTPDPGDDNPPGTYNLVATRTGGGNEGAVFDIVLRVELGDTTGGGSCQSGDEACFLVSTDIFPR